VSAGLLSGEVFGKLLNGIFAKHGLKQSVKLVQGADHHKTWEAVTQGLHRLSVELDEDTIKSLASGDVGLVTELVAELHQVYRHWVATEVKKRRRRQVERRSQPQQGGGYSRAGGNKAGVGTEPASEKGSVLEPTPRELPASISASVDPTPREVQPERRQDTERTPKNAAERKQGTDRSPRKSVPEELDEDVDVEQNVGRGAMHKSSSVSEMPEVANGGAVSSTDARLEGQHVAPTVAPSAQRNAALEFPDYDFNAPQQPFIKPRAPAHEKPGVNVEMVLRDLSVDCEIESAETAPELMALSMLHHLRISPSQARSLLVEDGRRLARAFGDGSERHATYMMRWLRSLSFYCGAMVELLLLYPDHVVYVLTALGHGVRAASPAVAEVACRILATICGGLQSGRLGAQVFRLSSCKGFC
jgi:hypothetical protein